MKSASLLLIGSALFSQQPNTQINIPVIIGCASLPEGTTLDTIWTVKANFAPESKEHGGRTSIIDIGYIANQEGSNTFNTTVHQKDIPLHTRHVTLYLSNDPMTKFTLQLPEDKLRSQKGDIIFKFNGEAKLTDNNGHIIAKSTIKFNYHFMYPDEIAINGYIYLLNKENNEMRMVFSPIYSKENFNVTQNRHSKP